MHLENIPFWACSGFGAAPSGEALGSLEQPHQITCKRWTFRPLSSTAGAPLLSSKEGVGNALEPGSTPAVPECPDTYSYAWPKADTPCAVYGSGYAAVEHMACAVSLTAGGTG